MPRTQWCVTGHDVVLTFECKHDRHVALRTYMSSCISTRNSPAAARMATLLPDVSNTEFFACAPDRAHMHTALMIMQC